MNILVVDDDEMILEIFEDFLNSMDTRSVLTAKDGVEALDLCRNNKIDFCFTDLNMPGMDGIEFVKRVHQLDNTLPVVVMTGYPSADNAIATLKSGVVDFLVKPFKMEEIELTIRRVLEKRALFVENVLLKEELEGKERLQALNRELSDKIKDLKALNVILQEIDWVTSSSELFDLIVRLAAEITASDETHFYLVDENMRSWEPIASFYRKGREGDPSTQAWIQEILTRKMSDGTPLLMKDGHDDSLSGTQICSLVAVPLKIRWKIFGVLVGIIKDRSALFTEKDLHFLGFMNRRASFVIENAALYENIYQNLFATLYAFVEAIEARDPYTKQHSSRVTEFAISIGREMGCSDEQLDLLNFSGHLHDIGKIGIPDRILLKPGPLTDDEYEVIKTHPVIGAKIIGHLGLMAEEQKVIRHHHERWDGHGYPDGLKGESIPFLSRILAVADAYDAMASDRAYRKKIPDELIIKMVRENAGSQFDSEVVRAFLKVYQKGRIASGVTAFQPAPCGLKAKSMPLNTLQVAAPVHRY